jgi:MFS family permease
VIGLMEGIAEALAAMLKLFSGVISDRFNARKWPMLLGYSIPALVRPAFAFASTMGGALSLRILDRLGKAFRSAPRDALLAQSVAPEQRALAFGLHRSMDHLGAVIGPLLAFLLISLAIPVRDALLYSIVPGLLCVLLCLVVKDTDAPVRRKAHQRDWRWSNLPAPFRRYLIALALFSLGNSSNMFLLLRAQESGLSTANVLLCWALLNFIATVATTPLTLMSSRVGRIRLLAWGWAAYLLIYLVFAFASTHLFVLIAAFAAMGLFIAATDGVEKTLVSELLPPERAGSAFGWYYLASGLPLLPASIVFGELSVRLSMTWGFVFSSACVLLAVLALLTVRAAQPSA